MGNFLGQPPPPRCHPLITALIFFPRPNLKNVRCLGCHRRNSHDSPLNYHPLDHSFEHLGIMTSASLSELLGITGGTMKTPSARSWSHAWTARHNDSMPLEKKISHGPYMGRMVFLPIHEWLIFMVNVGKYTIHGWYGHFHMSLIGTECWISILLEMYWISVYKVGPKIS